MISFLILRLLFCQWMESDCGLNVQRMISQRILTKSDRYNFKYYRQKGVLS